MTRVIPPPVVILILFSPLLATTLPLAVRYVMHFLDPADGRMRKLAADARGRHYLGNS